MKIIYFFTFAFLFIGCVKDSNYDEPNYEELKQKARQQASSFDGNQITYTQLRAKATTSIGKYVDNDAFEGFVISSDESGNFYKKIYIQAEDKSGTIAISVEKKGLSGDFPMGSKVQVRLKDTSFWFNSRYSLLEVGLGEGKTAGGNVKIESLPPSMYNQVLVSMGEIEDVKNISTIFNNIHSINKAQNTNLLLTIKNVNFEPSAIGKTFHLPSNQFNTSYNLIDTSGGKVAFITSSFANYTSEIVPNKKVNVTGILTKYGTGYQFYISNFTDLEITE